MLMSGILNDRFFDDMFRVSFPEMTGSFFREGKDLPSMRADIYEDEKAYRLELEMPGFKKEDMKASLKDGYLTITASGKEEGEKKDESGRYIRRERYNGSVSRSFYVGKQVTEEDISARFEDGILKMQIAKKAIPEKKESFIAIEG